LAFEMQTEEGENWWDQLENLIGAVENWQEVYR
jgi:hypothetical protein